MKKLNKSTLKKYCPCEDEKSSRCPQDCPPCWGTCDCTDDVPQPCSYCAEEYMRSEMKKGEI